MPSATGPGSIVYLKNTGHVQVPQSTTTLQGTNAPSVTASAAAPLATATSIPISTVTVPASHVLPNLSAWTFPTGPSNPPVIVNPVTSSATVIPTVLPATSVASTASLVIPVTILTRRLLQLCPHRAAHQYRLLSRPFLQQQHYWQLLHSSLYRNLLLQVSLSKILRNC